MPACLVVMTRYAGISYFQQIISALKVIFMQYVYVCAIPVFVVSFGKIVTGLY